MMMTLQQQLSTKTSALTIASVTSSPMISNNGINGVGNGESTSGSSSPTSPIVGSNGLFGQRFEETRLEVIRLRRTNEYLRDMLQNQEHLIKLLEGIRECLERRNDDLMEICSCKAFLSPDNMYILKDDLTDLYQKYYQTKTAQQLPVNLSLTSIDHHNQQQQQQQQIKTNHRKNSIKLSNNNLKQSSFVTMKRKTTTALTAATAAAVSTPPRVDTTVSLSPSSTSMISNHLNLSIRPSSPSSSFSSISSSASSLSPTSLSISSSSSSSASTSQPQLSSPSTNSTDPNVEKDVVNSNVPKVSGSSLSSSSSSSTTTTNPTTTTTNGSCLSSMSVLQRFRSRRTNIVPLLKLDNGSESYNLPDLRKIPASHIRNGINEIDANRKSSNAPIECDVFDDVDGVERRKNSKNGIQNDKNNEMIIADILNGLKHSMSTMISNGKLNHHEDNDENGGEESKQESIELKNENGNKNVDNNDDGDQDDDDDDDEEIEIDEDQRPQSSLSSKSNVCKKNDSISIISDDGKASMQQPRLPILKSMLSPRADVVEEKIEINLNPSDFFPGSNNEASNGLNESNHRKKSNDGERSVSSSSKRTKTNQIISDSSLSNINVSSSSASSASSSSPSKELRSTLDKSNISSTNGSQPTSASALTAAAILANLHQQINPELASNTHHQQTSAMLITSPTSPASTVDSVPGSPGSCNSNSNGCNSTNGPISNLRIALSRKNNVSSTMLATIAAANGLNINLDAIRPHKCHWPDCKFATKDRKTLRTHMRIHTKEKPFKCSFPNCSYETGDPSNYRKHKRRHIAHTIFACDYEGCNFTTNKPDFMQSHIAIHKGLKPFLCDFENCSSSFYTRSKLEAHRRKHLASGEFPMSLTHVEDKDKPIVCTYPNCGKRFINAAGLAGHEVTHLATHNKYGAFLAEHEREKPVVCNFPNCGKRFLNTAGLAGHEVTHRNFISQNMGAIFKNLSFNQLKSLGIFSVAKQQQQQQQQQSNGSSSPTVSLSQQQLQQQLQNQFLSALQQKLSTNGERSSQSHTNSSKSKSKSNSNTNSNNKIGEVIVLDI